MPFIDTEVVKAAFSLAGEDKIRGREQKAHLKKAAERFLPKEIIYRPKAAFSAPLRAWVQRDLAELVDDTLPNGELVKSGFIKREGIARLIDLDRRGIEDRSKEIWQLLSMETWLQSIRQDTQSAASQS